MKRIICHWTAGRNKASKLDRKHYHFIFEGDGSEVAGDLPVEANRAPIRGPYAAHTRNCNSDSIGLSMACMLGAKEGGPYGSHPMTFAQFDAMARKAAQLCRRYGIPVTPQTVLWHAEVQHNLGIAQRGKWDATVLPFNGLKGRKECGDYLRQLVSLYVRELHPRQETPPQPLALAMPADALDAAFDDDKPVFAQTTNIAALGGFGTTVAAVLGALAHPAVQVVALLLAAGFAFWILKERRRRTLRAREIIRQVEG